MKKSIFRKIGILALCVSMIGVFASCGSSSDSSDSSSSKKEKTYNVVFEATFPPFDTTDDNGDPAGFDVDMMNAIGEKEGFKVKFTTMSFDALIPALQAGNADIIASGMNADDPNRQKKVDFSKRYYKSGLIVMVKKDNKTIKGINSLTSSMKVASQTGTTGATEAQKLQKQGKIKEAVILDGFDTCVMQLQNGDVNAVIIDKPVGEEYMNKHPNKFKAVGKVLDAERYGIAVKKGNKKLLKKINDGLNAIIKDGTYEKLCKKYNLDPLYTSEDA
jgi:ABC-type amino acid transport substrate-binding protein